MTNKETVTLWNSRVTRYKERTLGQKIPADPFTVRYEKSYLTGELAGTIVQVTEVTKTQKERAALECSFLYGQDATPQAPGEIEKRWRMVDSSGEYEVRKLWITELGSWPHPQKKTKAGGPLWMPCLYTRSWLIAKSGGFSVSYHWKKGPEKRDLYTMEAVTGCPEVLEDWKRLEPEQWEMHGPAGDQ